MSFTKTYDVFIAYHGSYATDGSRSFVDQIFDYLTSRGLTCFYFPRANKDTYKSNIIEVMHSRVFLLVCTKGIHLCENGKIDTQHHYELSTEIDAFYALTQVGEVSVSNARVVACGDFHKGDEAKFHELFANRTHLYYNGGEDGLQEIYKWVREKADNHETWQRAQITSEIQEVFSTRAAMNQNCQLNDRIATAHTVRVVGISNSEVTARIDPKAIVNCVENGGSVEMLFLDPEGQFTGLREQEEGLRVNRIKNITNVNIDTALGFYDRIKVNKDNYKLYTYDKQPRMNMIFVDDCLLLQYYANKIPGIENPTFFIVRQDNSPIFQFCENAYNYLKSDAVQIEV